MLVLHSHFKTHSEFQFLIDESTVQSSKNAYKNLNIPFANETRLGLIETYADPISNNSLGGISRRGPTPLIIFTDTFKYLIPFKF
jgi:hypothetical protein